MLNVYNFVLFQIGWLGTVYSAAHGLPYIGVIYTFVWATLHFSLFSKQRAAEFKLILWALVIGYSLDSALVLLNLFNFPEQAQFGGPSTFWMAALWANLAMTLHFSLSWLKNRVSLQILFGLFGGPLAYFAGAKLGGIILTDSYFSLGMIGVEWAVATPLLFWLAQFLEREPGFAMNQKAAERS